MAAQSHDSEKADRPNEARRERHKRLPAVFFQTEAGNEPVREWIRDLPADDRKRIGRDIAAVEFGWPIGMPICKALSDGIYEVRSRLSHNRAARVLFYPDRKGRMVLLDGFMKKTRTTRADDLNLARSNKRKHERGLK